MYCAAITLKEKFLSVAKGLHESIAVLNELVNRGMEKNLEHLSFRKLYIIIIYQSV